MKSKKTNKAKRDDAGDPIGLFPTQADWAGWLEKNHRKSQGLWLRLAKKGSALQSVTYGEALELALCYGWIDGQKRGESEQAWLQRFLPRSAKSIWSKINRDKAAALIVSGRMKVAGLEAVEAAKQAGRWDTAYDSPRGAKVSEDFQAALGANPRAREFFQSLDGANRFAVLFRIQTAKKAETRARKIREFVEMLEKNETIHEPRKTRRQPKQAPPQKMAIIKIIGAGLAGSEAAWQCARRGLEVELYEMRPLRSTPAHQTEDFAELVCSNSLKSDSENTAPWLLKEEMRRAGSLLLEIARECAVPAGHALAVDRITFATRVTEAISREARIAVRREEVTAVDELRDLTIIATGPLTSDALASEIARLSERTESGSQRAGAPALHGPHLYFYDSISPIVEADSIDRSRVYMAARYDKGSADYINCPMTPEEYDHFYDALLAAQSVEERDWEKLNYFESCLPIEEIARRGRDTLRFGPMKPVGLLDPRTGKMPYAVVQLRQENLRADSYNLVGFQNHLKFGEQARVLRLIPGLENARFLRYGQIHRNTYLNAPTLLRGTLQMKAHPRVLFAGQICGVEGYVESIATGLLAGMHAAALASGAEMAPAPRASAFGSLTHYVAHADAKNFQPANITFDLLPPLEKKIRDRKERHRAQCELALKEFDAWMDRVGTAAVKA